ncbi:MmgE/PrpD family protein [Halococcus agarilyticus]|uniref:MmgE/PrpD family protein n=1 Tax=Halococcus agarilyticus TaxID=1232219 RepID=UPI001E646DEC|nr:MmgE/PrpD family protein [Halococcus agarilyticus]
MSDDARHAERTRPNDGATGGGTAEDGTTDDDHTRRLAAWVAELDSEDVPPSVEDRVGLVVADTLGVMIGGASDDAVAGLREAWRERSDDTGDATVLAADSGRASRHRAAFLNATSGTVLELDEGHRFAAGHPAIHVLPALLAEAETRYADREAFLTAFVAGYETAVRVAEAVQPLAEGYHPHGVWGVVGGAAAVSRLRDYDAATTRTALAIAANYAQHTRFAAATAGATVRNSYAGMSNLASLIAADQAQAGFSGLDDGIAAHLAPASAAGVAREHLAADLGDRWTLSEGYFKTHAACRYTHAPLDALDGIDGEPAAEEVEAVVVETYAAAAKLDDPHPRNALAAKFSVPFAVATALRTGSTDAETFTNDAVAPETLALAERVAVRVDEEIDARAPDERGARVTVTLADGTEASAEVRHARGGEADPFEPAELRTKFASLVAPAIGSERTDRLWTAARDPAPPRVLCAMVRGGEHPER